MKSLIDKLKSLKTGTIVRTILQILAYVNQVVALAGMTFGFIDSAVYQWISFILTLVITALSYWYNNDWSNLAQTTGEVFDMVKDGEITMDELKTFVENHKKSGE